MEFKEGKTTKKVMVDLLKDMGFNVVFTGADTSTMKDNIGDILKGIGESVSGKPEEDKKETGESFTEFIQKRSEDIQNKTTREQTDEKRESQTQSEEKLTKEKEPLFDSIFNTIEDSINKGIAPNDLVELGFISLEDLNRYFKYLSYFKAGNLQQVQEIKEFESNFDETLQTYEDVGGVDREDFSHFDYGDYSDEEGKKTSTLHSENPESIPERFLKMITGLDEENGRCGDCDCFGEEEDEDLCEGNCTYDSGDGYDCPNCYDQGELINITFSEGFLNIDVDIEGIAEGILGVLNEVVEDITNQHESEESQDLSEKCECGGMLQVYCDCDEADGCEDETNQRRQPTSFKHVVGISDKEGAIKAFEEFLNMKLK